MAVETCRLPPNVSPRPAAFRPVAGQPVSLDAYPYAAGSTVLLPRFMDPRIRIRLSWSKPLPEMAGRNLADIAAEWDYSLEQAAVRLDPASAVYFQMDEADVRRILAHP